MAKKTAWIQSCIRTLEQLAVLDETVQGLTGVYTARKYSTTYPITDDDMKEANSAMTAAEFNANVITVLADLNSFGHNVALPAKDRKASMNIAREDI